MSNPSLSTSATYAFLFSTLMGPEMGYAQPLEAQPEPQYLDAKLEMGSMVLDQESTTGNYAESLTNAYWAAQQGDPKAKQSFLSLVFWVQMAAKYGDADAQYARGRMSAEGLGVVQDKAKAIEWYKKAADQGHREAEFDLGVIHNHAHLKHRAGPVLAEAASQSSGD